MKCPFCKSSNIINNEGNCLDEPNKPYMPYICRDCNEEFNNLMLRLADDCECYEQMNKN